jgi:hypothetical protein
LGRKTAIFVTNASQKPVTVTIGFIFFSWNPHHHPTLMSAAEVVLGLGVRLQATRPQRRIESCDHRGFKTFKLIKPFYPNLVHALSMPKDEGGITIANCKNPNSKVAKSVPPATASRRLPLDIK